MREGWRQIGGKSILLLWLLVGHLALWPALAAKPLGIVGPDDRELFDAEDFPYLNAVGRLNVEGRGFCSAVLIAPAEILTAGHCVWDFKSNKLLPADILHFVPGYRRNSYLGHSRGKSVRVAETLAFKPDGDIVDLTDDWAVITLELNITAATGIKPVPLAGRRTIAGLTGESRLLRAGYGRDRPHLPVMVSPCSMRALLEERELLVHDCDATSGDSGSPIMAMRDGKPAVIAIHSAIATFEDAVFGVGVVLARHLPADVLKGQIQP